MVDLSASFTFHSSRSFSHASKGLRLDYYNTKKGKKDHPANYRPISLLKQISTMYAKYLQEAKLIDGLESKDILRDEQAGFRAGQSTLESVLQYLVQLGAILLYCIYQFQISFLTQIKLIGVD